MRAVSLLSAVVAVIIGASSVSAWWCTGHMVIAEIARQNLDAKINEKVDTYFKFLNTWFEKTDNMISGACWADDLKSDKLETMAGWHFINQPYNPESVPIHPFPIQEVNVETNIQSLSETIEKDKYREWVTAFAVANLVHFYGDIHQPLHATELFDAEFPHGDKGGNLFHVTWQGQPWRLHFIWDSVCGQYVTEPERPLNQSSYDYIKSLATQYMANYSISESDKKVFNSTIMALESLQAAIVYSYANNTLKPNASLTDSYIDTCMQVAGFRLVAAGYRLANHLNYLFKHDVSGAAMLSSVKEAKSDYKRAVLEHGHKVLRG